MPAKPANGWRAVSTRQPGESLKIKLGNGRVIKGNFKSASDDGLALELKNKEVSLSRDEIASVAVGGKRFAGKAASVEARELERGRDSELPKTATLFSRVARAAIGAGIFGGMGAAAGSLNRFAIGRPGHKEVLVYQAN